MNTLSLITTVALEALLLSFVWAALVFFKTSNNASKATVLVKGGAITGLVIHPWGIGHAELAPTLQLAGLAVIGLSGLIFGLTLLQVRGLQFNEVFSKPKAKRVVRDGLFRIFRHPFYFSYVMAYVGASLSGGQLYQWLHAGFMAVLYALAAMREEKLLRKRVSARREPSRRQAA